MPDSTLEQTAAELYALPLDEFTRERDARAKATGDRVLAAGIRSLRKPSLAAWLVGLLAREASDDLARALELGADLREAQEDLDVTALAELTKQRRALVSGLARRAAALAADAGVTARPATLQEVEKTLNAAMRDAGATAAVLSGRLVRTLDAVGFDPVDLEGAVAGGAPAPASAPARDDLAERRARRAAERAARDAAQTASAAERDAAAAEAALVTARERVDHLRGRIDDLRRELTRLERDAEEADAAASAAAQARDEAVTRAKAARRQAEAHATEGGDDREG